MSDLSPSKIRSAAEAFWRRAGGMRQFGEPVDIERAIIRALPLAVQRVENLTTTRLAEFLAVIGMSAPEETARELSGCLVADAGVGFILVNSSDSEDEQRLSLAHELAHFLLHYLEPRIGAVGTFGPSFAAVLDRLRPATPAELFSSALRDVPIEPFRHSMARPTGKPVGNISAMEEEAEDLAVELLVPSATLRAMSTLDASTIVRRFGIPLVAATRLAEIYGSSRSTTIGVVGLFGVQ